jgi:hypothetical protein
LRASRARVALHETDDMDVLDDGQRGGGDGPSGAGQS